MIKLRNSCTGRWPVHFYRKLSVAAAALVAGRRAHRAWLADAGHRGDRRRPRRGQTIADFYKARKRRAAVACAERRAIPPQQLISLAQYGEPRRARSRQLSAVAPFRRRWRPRDGGKRKDVAARRAAAVRRLSSAYVQATAHRSRRSGSPMSIPQLRPTPPSPLAALLGAASAPSLAEYVRTMGWMHPFYGELRATPWPTTSIATTTSASCSRSTCSARASFPPESSATSSSTPRSSGSSCTRTASRSIRWSWSSASPNIRRRCSRPISATPRSILIGTCRPTSPGRTSASS